MPVEEHETVVVDRVVTGRGEVVLRRRGEHFEIISNGVFLMDSRGGASERLLVRSALDAAPPPRDLLIGGLGVGFSLDEALRHDPPAGSVTVVEVEPVVIGWHSDHLRHFAPTAHDDPRLRIVRADLIEHLATTSDRYDAICLDIDNGPEWTVADANRSLYDDAGLASVRARLRPGGVVAVWSASWSAAFEARLGTVFTGVTTRTVPVPRGEPDVVQLARRE